MMHEPDCAGVGVFVGVDVAKDDHYACAVTAAGDEALSRPVANDEAAITGLIDEAAAYGAVALRRWTRRASPSPPRPPGATPSQSSPPSSTGSASAAAASPPTSRRR